MNNATGTFIVGVCAGCVAGRTQNNTDPAPWYLGVQVESPNGFPDPDLITKRFKLTKDQVQKGLQHQLEKLRGQQISVPFHTQEWKLDDGRTGVTNYVSNGYVPAAVGK